MLNAWKSKNYKRGEILYAEGEIANYLYLLIDGQCALEKTYLAKKNCFEECEEQ
jgi:CRP-like cAMP-binding protein